MAENNLEKKEKLVIGTAPHIRSKQSISRIMWLVVLALMPSTLYSIWLFGINAFALYATSIVTAVICEAIFQKCRKKPVTTRDGSAILTGLLLAMNVPPEAPLWMVAIGSAFAIIVVKQMFGGLGFNIFNPALAGRAFMLASWPVHMTTKWHNFTGAGDVTTAATGMNTHTNFLAKDIQNTTNLPQQGFDLLTGATPLGALKEGPNLLKDLNVDPATIHHALFSNDMLISLFKGNIGGVIGETSALLLLLGGLFLIWKKIVNWRIPTFYIGTVAIFMLIYYCATGCVTPGRAVLFHLLSGGLFLGAFFMATDMVTSPLTNKGIIIFAIGCGLLTSVIRLWGGYPEGVSYSILLMNATVPLIDRLCKPKKFGIPPKKKKEAEAK